MKKNLILAAVGVVCLLVGYGLGVVFPGAGSFGGAMGKEDAKTEVQDFVNEYLVSEGQEAQVTDTSKEGGMYKMNIDLQGQSIESYMTKDGKTFFPQAIDMEDPESQLSPEGDAASQQQSQQQMSPSEQADAMVSQGKGLLDQHGDSITDEEKQDLEEEIDALEELTGSEEPSDEELENKMQDVQEASQPLIEKVMEEQQQQQGGEQGGEAEVVPQE